MTARRRTTSIARPARTARPVLAAVAAAALLAAPASAATAATAPIGTDAPLPRIAGDDRYATAAQLALATTGGATTQHVVLANGEEAGGGVDALSSAYLAGVVDAPVLLTEAAGTPAATATALAALFGATPAAGSVLHVVGGTSAVSDAQLAALATALPGVTVQRISGADRYETAAASAVAGGVQAAPYTAFAEYGALPTAILTSGVSTADALAAGQVAYAGGYPLLLTGKDALPASTVAAMDALGVEQVVVVGGPDAISLDVSVGLLTAGYSVVYALGEDRYSTATALLSLASAEPGRVPTVLGGMGLGFFDATGTYLASGTSFADALAAAPLAGSAERPLLLTDPAGQSEASQLWTQLSAATTVTGIGGTAALPEVVLAQATAALAVPAAQGTVLEPTLPAQP